MSDETGSPENDRDLEMARRLGEHLERGSLDDATPPDQDRPLWEALLAVRRHVDARRETPSEESRRRLWTRIEQSAGRVRRDRRSLERIVRRAPRWVWTSMAAVLLVGTVVTLLMLSGPTTTLVASAESDAVLYTADDGSVVTLRPHSKLYRIEEGVRYRLAGEAFFEVTPRNGESFSVEAGRAVVEVLGTRFNVSTWGETPAVFLEEGRVRFAHIVTGAAVILEPGQASRLTVDGGVSRPMVAEPDEHVDWMNGEILLDRQPIGRVAAELSHHYAIAIEIPAALRGQTLSGRILLGEADRSLEDLAQVIGGRFVATGPSSYRFEPE